MPNCTNSRKVHKFKKLVRKSLLTEEQCKEDNEYAIKKAATSGHATLSTAVFGRGTDFVCLDEKLLKQGGVHVIQTFLSTDKSEELQTRGRTARQGKAGSYRLVLLEDGLKAFDLTLDQYKAVPSA